MLRCSLPCKGIHSSFCLYSCAAYSADSGDAVFIPSVALQVRQKRQDRFHEARMRKAKQQQARSYTPTLWRNPYCCSVLLIKTTDMLHMTSPMYMICQVTQVLISWLHA